MFLSVTEILRCSALYNYVLTFAIKIQWLHNPLFYDTLIYYLGGFSEAFVQLGLAMILVNSQLQQTKQVGHTII